MSYSDRIIPSRERTRTRLNLPSKGISKSTTRRSHSLYSSNLNRGENRYSAGITGDIANNNGVGGSLRSKALLSSSLPSVASRSRTSLGLNAARPESGRLSFFSSRPSAGITLEDPSLTDRNTFGGNSLSKWWSGSKPSTTAATTTTTDNAILPGSLPNFFDSSNLNNNNSLNHNLTLQRSSIRERLLNRLERPKTHLPLSYRKKPAHLEDYNRHQHTISPAGYNSFATHDKAANSSARLSDIGRLRLEVPNNSVSSSASRNLYPDVQKASHLSSLSSKYLGAATIGPTAYDDLFTNRQRFNDQKEFENLPDPVNRLKFDRLPKVESKMNQKPLGNYDAKDDIIEAGEEFLPSDNDINIFQSQNQMRQHQQSQVPQQHQEHTGSSILGTLVSKLSSFFKPPENISDYEHVQTMPGSSGSQVRTQQGEAEAQKSNDKQSNEDYAELDNDSDLERKQRNKKLNELVRKEKKKKKKLKKLMKKSRKSNNEESDINSHEHLQQVRHENTDQLKDKGKNFLKQKTMSNGSENKVKSNPKEKESKEPAVSYRQALRKKRGYEMGLGDNPSLTDIKKQRPNISKETPNIFLETEPKRRLGLNFLKNNNDDNNFSSLEEQKTAKKSISSTPDSNSDYTKHDSSMTSHDSKNSDLIDNRSSSKDPSLRQQNQLEELKQKDQVIFTLNNKISLLENSLIDIQKSLQSIREKQEKKSNQPTARKKYEKSRQRLENLVSSTPALSVVDKSELLKGLDKITADDDMPENGESPQIKKRMSVREKLSHEAYLHSKSKSSIFSNDSRNGSQSGKEAFTERPNKNKDEDVTITKTPDVIIEDFKKISERIYERERSLAESSRNSTNNSRNLQQQEVGLADQYSKLKQYKQQLEQELQEVEKSQLTNQAVTGTTSSLPSHEHAAAPESDDEFDETNIDETLAKIEKSMGGLSPIKVSFRE